MRVLSHVVLLLGGLTVACWTDAQTTSWKLECSGHASSARFAGKNYATRAQADEALSAWYAELVSSGFLDARIDTSSESGVLRAACTPGMRYYLVSAEQNADSSQRAETDPDPFDSAQFMALASYKLRYFENNGFPFAKMLPCSFDLRDSVFYTSWCSESGPQIRFDSLIIKSADRIPQKYVQHYLGYRGRKKDLYSEKYLKTLPARLAEIPFVQVKGAPEVLFREGTADVYLYLSRKKANYFNGVIGLQPEDGGRVTITGDLEIKLLNAFNSGEEFFFNWRRLRNETQDLHVKLMLPYLLGTPLGTEGSVRIYRRDSTFTSFRGQFALVFQLGGGNQLRTLIERNTSSGLSSGISGFAISSVQNTLYGLSIQWARLDYRYNPRKGFSVQSEVATGRRTETLPVTDDAPREITGAVYRVQAITELYIPTFKKQTIRLAAQGASYTSDRITDNEMFRIGGLRTIRGIDEEGIFASSYLITTIEYRLLPEANSALYLFADQAWYERRSTSQYLRDQPLGFGAGVQFSTRAGIFLFNYGLAQQFDNPLLVRNARLSFGFRNLF